MNLMAVRGGDRSLCSNVLERTAAASMLAGYIFIFLLAISFSTPVEALQYVPGSPCESVCSDSVAGKLDEATVCLDAAFQNSSGSAIRECTTCLLNSTAVDTAQNISDVDWALLNFRYILSECLYAYPQQIVSVSSPCQVVCAPLSPAIKWEIGPNASNATDGIVPNLDYCFHDFGPDTVINNCTFCYSFVPQQLYLGNFMQALHIACRQPPVMGQTFYPNGQAIFNDSAIPGPVAPSNNKNKGGTFTSWKLALVIALPIVGGAMFFALSCFCCFRFTKGRRERMAASGRMSRFHDGAVASGGLSSMYTSPVLGRTPPSKYEWPMVTESPDQEMQTMEHVQHTPPKSHKQKSPGLSQGRWSNHGTIEPEPSSAIPRDDVGPGGSQTQDPFLHEQYFGDQAEIGRAMEYEYPQPGGVQQVPTLHAAPRPYDRM